MVFIAVFLVIFYLICLIVLVFYNSNGEFKKTSYKAIPIIIEMYYLDSLIFLSEDYTNHESNH